MTTNTTPTDLKDFPEVHRLEAPEHRGPKLPGAGKSKKRGIVWVLLLAMVAGVAGYAVWKAWQPVASPQQGQGGRGRGGRGRGGGGLGPIPVVTANVKRANLPVYLNGLGSVTAFYTVTVKSRVDGQLM